MRPLPGLRVHAGPPVSLKHREMAPAFAASSSLPEESLALMRRDATGLQESVPEESSMIPCFCCLSTLCEPTAPSIN